MSDLKEQIALTALNVMFQKGTFYISEITDIAKMLGVNPEGEALSMLRPLHCVKFADMPEVVRKAVPGLIQRCLGVEPIFQFETLDQVVVELKPKRGLWKLLDRKIL